MLEWMKNWIKKHTYLITFACVMQCHQSVLAFMSSLSAFIPESISIHHHGLRTITPCFSGRKDMPPKKNTPWSSAHTVQCMLPVQAKCASWRIRGRVALGSAKGLFLSFLLRRELWRLYVFPTKSYKNRAKNIKIWHRLTTTITVWLTILVDA